MMGVMLYLAGEAVGFQVFGEFRSEHKRYHGTYRGLIGFIGTVYDAFRQEGHRAALPRVVFKRFTHCL